MYKINTFSFHQIPMDVFTEATGVGNESIPTYGTLTDRDCVKRNLRSTLVSFGILKIIFKLSGWSDCGSAGRHSDLRSFSSCRFWKRCHRDSRNWITLYSPETKLASSTSVFGSLLYCNGYYGEVSTTSHSDLNCTAYGFIPTAGESGEVPQSILNPS